MTILRYAAIYCVVGAIIGSIALLLDHMNREPREMLTIILSWALWGPVVAIWMIMAAPFNRVRSA